MENKITLDNYGESVAFRATRNVRDGQHSLGTIRAGEYVCFRSLGNDPSVTLFYCNGEPTNGNQYLTLRDLTAAQDFVTRHEFVAIK